MKETEPIQNVNFLFLWFDNATHEPVFCLVLQHQENHPVEEVPGLLLSGCVTGSFLESGVLGAGLACTCPPCPEHHLLHLPNHTGVSCF